MSFDLENICPFLQRPSSSNIFFAGCDEVGRGPLAGPVVGGCVLLSFRAKVDSVTLINDLKEFVGVLHKLGVRDSKKLKAQKRKKILEDLNISSTTLDSLQGLRLTKNVYCFISLSEVDHVGIDEINILNASMTAMKNAFENCHRGSGSGDAGLALFDGNRIPNNLPGSLTAKAQVKGDSKSVLIGLASIIAKEYRDNYMRRMGEIYPGYGFEGNAGYPTKAHKEAISRIGLTPIHRRTFNGVKEYIDRVGS